MTSKKFAKTPTSPFGREEVAAWNRRTSHCSAPGRSEVGPVQVRVRLRGVVRIARAGQREARVLSLHATLRGKLERFLFVSGSAYTALPISEGECITGSV